MRQHRTLLVVHQYFLSDPIQVFKAAHQSFISVLRILAVATPEMEASRVAQRVDDEVHVDLLPAHARHNLAPVALQLPTGRCFEAHRGLALALYPLRPHIVSPDAALAAVACHLFFPQDDHGLPHPLTQQLVYLALDGSSLLLRCRWLGLGAPPRCTARLTVLACTPSSAAMSTL